jgi:hypothetical protein
MHVSVVEVREEIYKWLKCSREKFEKNNISIEVLKDNDICLRVELNFGEILAEILVEEPDFAHYRYVFFQAMGMVNGVPNLVHFWCDNEESTIGEILNNLDTAIKICADLNFYATSEYT